MMISKALAPAKLVLPALVLAATVLTAAAVSAAGGQDAPGKQVYEQANCVGCHKWSGMGGGGYGGSALSLRQTELSRDEIMETVKCGRPGTGMPHFTAAPYADGGCYGLKEADVKDIMPPAANVVLAPKDIEAVAGYVVDNIKGRGPPTLEDCVAFFGDASRVCDVLRSGDGTSHHALPTPTTTN